MFQCLSLCILSAILLGILYLCKYRGPFSASQLTFPQSLVHSHWSFVTIMVSAFPKLVLHSWACLWVCLQASVLTLFGGECTAGSCGKGKRKGVSLVARNQSFGSHRRFLALGSSQLHFSVSCCRYLTFNMLLITSHAGFGWTTYSS